MKYILSALVGASLVVATGAVAQAPMVPSKSQANPNTKVYAYKKEMPKAADPAAPSAKPAFEYLPNSVQYGSQRWWEMMNRTTVGSE